MNALTNDFFVSMIKRSFIFKGVEEEEYTPVLDRENCPQAER